MMAESTDRLRRSAPKQLQEPSVPPVCCPTSDKGMQQGYPRTYR
ncbi:hypothetical protein LINPERPRIM_LOCUS7601 [Linum perenne]